jgi:RHS repeat-associated protein
VNTTANRELRTENNFHYDSNGNVILLTDTQGRESARYAYDAFGKTLTATGPAARGNRYRFSTKPVEEESGLVYYGYRYYDPVTGRWPSRDPIEETGGVNLYQAADNNALNKVDYLGMSVTPTPVSATPIVVLGLNIAFWQGLESCEGQAGAFVGPINCKGCCQIGIILTNQDGTMYYVSTFSYALWAPITCNEMEQAYLNAPQIKPLNQTVYWAGM